MPLARIITDSVEDSLELSIQLRARGFQVETVAPGDVPNTLADLEVRLEECSPEDVMTRAAETSQDLDDLWVFVAPGALDDRVRPIREVSTTAQNSEALPAQRKAIYAKPVVHINVPEDDPLLCELEAQAGSAVPVPVAARSAIEPIRIEAAKPAPKVVVTSPVAREMERELSPVVVFPRPAVVKPEPQRVAPVSKREPEPPADMQFWRIASVVAVLAIAALIFGANMSREPQPITSQSAPAVPSVPHLQFAKSLPTQPPAARAYVPQRRVVAAAAVPPATTPKPAATQPAAKKAIRHRPTVHHDDYIAQDTVVFYDGRGSAPRKASPSTGSNRSDRN